MLAVSTVNTVTVTAMMVEFMTQIMKPGRFRISWKLRRVGFDGMISGGKRTVSAAGVKAVATIQYSGMTVISASTTTIVTNQKVVMPRGLTGCSGSSRKRFSPRGAPAMSVLHVLTQPTELDPGEDKGEG